MNEQGAQGSNNPQQPESNTPDSEELDPYKPDTRADVASRPLATGATRPRKYGDGKKLRKKNAQGILQYNVSIESARYDSAQHSWMYTLKDWQNERIAGETKETELG